MTDNYLAKVELLAEMFHADSGLLAPGKSVAPEMAASYPSDEERRERYRDWYEHRALDHALARLLRAEAELAAALSRLEDT